MLDLLLLEAILCLYFFSYQYCNFIGQKLLSKCEFSQNTMGNFALVSHFVGLYWQSHLQHCYIFNELAFCK